MYSVFGLRDQGYSNISIQGIHFVVVITMKYVYKYKVWKASKLQQRALKTDIHL